MAITYTNRKGRTYYLCVMYNEKGRPYHVFTHRIKGELVKKIPDGFTIYENENGQVYLVKAEQKKGTFKPVDQKKETVPSHPVKMTQKKQPPKPINQKAVTPKQALKPSTRDAIVDSRRNDQTSHGPKQGSSKQLSPNQRATKAHQNALEIAETECGWCYQRVYRVWQSNGKNRYYDDQDLKSRHQCIRPAHWEPDH